jgi:ornithine cyclodeaminase
MTLLLSRRDVAGLLDMPSAVECTERAFREQGAVGVVAHAPFMLECEGRELRVNVGALKLLKRGGLWAGMRGGLVYVLFDTESERLLGIMAYPFACVRVGATVGVAVRRLSRPDASRLLLIGSGRIAIEALAGVSAVRGFSNVEVSSRHTTSEQEFCEKARKRLGLDVHPVASLEEAVNHADVIVLATNAEGPAIQFDWLRPGTLVATAGIRCEIPEELYLEADMVVVGSKVHETDYVDEVYASHDNTLVRLANSGRLPWERVWELGDVLNRAVTVPDGITVFRESQGGFGDVALATWILEQAKVRGLGHEWNGMDFEFDRLETE